MIKLMSGAPFDLFHVYNTYTTKYNKNLGKYAHLLIILKIKIAR